MDKHAGHGDLVKSFVEDQKVIFDDSSQAVYAFLDDDCRVCNEKFAKMLGYESPEEWLNVDVQGSFPEAFVDEGSRNDLVSAYQNAMGKKVGSSIKVVWKKKSGGTIDSTVIVIPVSFQGHLFAFHFIS
jgi:antirestriction protein